VIMPPSLRQTRTLSRYKLPLLLVTFLHLFHLTTSQANSVRFNIEENLPIGALVGNVKTTDGYTYRESSEIPYFSVDGQTGDIRTAQVIDREALTKNEIKFVITAQRSSSDSHLIEVAVTILDLNDNAPSFQALSINHTLRENVKPEQPFTLTATDPDEGINGSAGLSYSIIDGDPQNYWFLNTTGGERKRATLHLLREVDRESLASFSLKVRVTDGGSPAQSSVVTVNVGILDDNDNHPKFDFSLYAAAVAENAPIGTLVTRTLATDEDSGVNAALFYSLTPNSLFQIDSRTGQISTRASLSEDAWAGESTCVTGYCNTTLCLTVCVLEVIVQDQNGDGESVLRDQSRVQIDIYDVNDKTPIPKMLVGSSPMSVSEDAEESRFIFSVSFTDGDRGPNANMTARFTSGNELGHFKLSGRIFSSTLYVIVRVNQTLDKRLASFYNLTITATDMGTPARSASFSVIVDVIAGNHHPPVFSRPSYSAIVSELDPVDSYVAALTATDADTGMLRCLLRHPRSSSSRLSYHPLIAIPLFLP